MRSGTVTRPPRSPWPLSWRIILLAIMVMVVTALYYSSSIPPSLHEASRRLYYVPIVLGSIWFGLRGGIAMAVAVVVVYSPHLLLDHHGLWSLEGIEDRVDMMLFVLFGLLLGLLSEQRLREFNRSLKMTEELEGRLNEILSLQEELKRTASLAALGELSAGIAHGIRSPLAAIRANAEVVAGEVDEDHTLYRFAQALVVETDRLNRVVSGVLLFARPNEGRDELRPVGVEIAIELAMDAVKPALEQRGISLVCQLPQGLPKVMGHTNALTEAFRIILENGGQAVGMDGRIQLGCRRGSRGLEVWIEDNGPGVSPAIRERIFEPFFSTRANGTGLGLAIAKRILDAHGGVIQVESPLEGGTGTRFRLFFPIPEEGGRP